MFGFSVSENMVEGKGREEEVENTPKLSKENKSFWWVVS